MPRSSTSFLFPDINVWLALSYERHIHYSIAQLWFEGLDANVRVCFSRFTQLGLLRLLTTDVVMGIDDVLSQTEAWRVYDRWLEDDRILLLEEPPSLERSFRALSQQKRPAPKDWADSYLAAFAAVAGLCLVTFDRALRAKSQDLVLLGA
jgi:toxin-antitoxin system PIN domain toxin